MPFANNNRFAIPQIHRITRCSIHKTTSGGYPSGQGQNSRSEIQIMSQSPCATAAQRQRMRRLVQRLGQQQGAALSNLCGFSVRLAVLAVNVRTCCKLSAERWRESHRRAVQTRRILARAWHSTRAVIAAPHMLLVQSPRTQLRSHLRM